MFNNQQPEISWQVPGSISLSYHSVHSSLAWLVCLVGGHIKLAEYKAKLIAYWFQLYNCIGRTNMRVVYYLII